MKKRLILALLVAAFVVSAVAVFVSGRWYLSQPIQSDASTPLLLDFRGGATARSVTIQVTEHFEKGNSALIYRLSQVFDDVDHLQAGLYEINGQQSWFDVWSMLTQGREKTFTVTLV